MEKWLRIRKQVLVEGSSKRQILRDTGIHWDTLKKILENPEPPGYRMSTFRPKPKIGPFLGRIQQILQGDKETHWKQRHTAKRIYQRLRDEEGYTGSYTTVKKEVRALKKKNREVFVPLVHRPGEAQVDFGYALARIDGTLRKIAFFVMCLPYSDAMFVMACESECTESFWEGHVRAFEFFGFVPTRITYDNSKVMVANITGCHKRKLTQGFLSLQSHYLFDEHFCTVRRANEKGIVEGCVKYSRRNFMVPVPQHKDVHELNDQLMESCIRDRQRRLRGHTGTKEELLKEDHAAGRALPAAPFEACVRTSAEATSLSLVRFKTNDYSVPSEYAYHLIDIKGYIDRVVLSCSGEIIAKHDRLWGREGVSFDPVHYLAILERKPGALDYARPLHDWELPACFDTLRRRLEIEFSRSQGTREYIRVLRLLENRSLPELTRAVEKGLRIHAHTRDAVAQFLYLEESGDGSLLMLKGLAHLNQVQVWTPDLRVYQSLLTAGGDRS